MSNCREQVHQAADDTAEGVRDWKCPASLEGGLLTLENGRVIDLKAVEDFLLQLSILQIPDSNDAEHEQLVEMIDEAGSVLIASGFMQVDAKAPLEPGLEEAEKGGAVVNMHRGSGQQKTISDDDVCSDCMHCYYQAGKMSTCALNWPGNANADGYVQECASFSAF